MHLLSGKSAPKKLKSLVQKPVVQTEDYDSDDARFYAVGPRVPERVLDLTVTSAQKRHLEPATRKGNIRKFQKFLHFCELYRKVPLPVSITDLCKYAAFLSLTFKSVDSIQNYLRGVSTLHKQCGVTSPDLKDHRIVTLLIGLSKQKRHVIRQAAPITPEMLAEMFIFLSLQDPYEATIWALFLVAFYCMLRKSNLTPSSQSGYNPHKILLRQDIDILQDALHVNIKWSKTKQAGGTPTVIPLLSIPGSCLCPVRAYRRMIALNPAGREQPAFINPDGNPILYSQYMDAIKYLSRQAGYNPRLFSTHSFRRGGATFGFRASVDVDHLKMQGSWASDAILDYIRLPEAERLKTFQLMRNEIVNSGL